jgi:uncharacterized protein YndB with AHSA1/START domain
MSNHPFEIERLFDAPFTKVWDALAKKEQLKEWYFQIADFKPVVGFEFQFIGKTEENKEYLHLCKVTEVVPGKKLVYSWRYDGLPGNSFVSFELYAEGQKTRLKLTHSGLESFAASGPDFVKQNFAVEWTYILHKSLKGYLKA